MTKHSRTLSHRARPLRRPLGRYPRSALAVAALLSAACTFPTRLLANATWIGPSGSWSAPSNWSLTTPPVPNDYVFLTQSDALQRTVTIDVSPPSLMDLTIDSTGAGVMGLSQSANNLAVQSNEYVGYSGTASYTQTGGTNSCDDTLRLGYNGGGTGTYSLSGASSILSVYAAEYIGYNGKGTLVQTGGLNSLGPSGLLQIAAGRSASGTYTLSGGTASAYRVYVGGSSSSLGGAGTLTIGPSASLSATSVFKIWDSIGTAVNLAGGSLSVGTLSNTNPSRFNWTGGTLSVTSVTPAISPAGPLGPYVKLSPGMTLRTKDIPTIDPTASLDIVGGSLVVAYFDPASADYLRSRLLAGRITSSAADAAHRLGYLDNGTTLTTLLTLAGDANLDGKLNADDYVLLDRAFAKGTTNAHWTDGDFNYDGVVNAADFLLIDTSYGHQINAFSPDFIAQRESQFGADYVAQLLTSVPEPASVTGLLIALPFLARRRQSR